MCVLDYLVSSFSTVGTDSFEFYSPDGAGKSCPAITSAWLFRSLASVVSRPSFLILSFMLSEKFKCASLEGSFSMISCFGFALPFSSFGLSWSYVRTFGFVTMQ
jgi:hypothetical protein